MTIAGDNIIPELDSVAPPVLDAVAAFARRLIAELDGKVPAGELAMLRQQAEAVNTGARTPVAPPPPDPTQPTIVRDEVALGRLATIVTDADEVVVDLETSDLDSRRGVIVGIGIAAGQATYYIPVNHRREDTGELRPDQLPLHQVLDALRLQSKPIIADNAKFELKWLARHGGITCRIAWDTMLAARLMNSNLPADLETLATRELDVPAWSLPAADMKRMEYLPIEKVAAYNGKDCWYTHLLARKQREVCT